MKKQIKPIGKNILIKIEEQKETKSGIALPTNNDYIQEYAEVIAAQELGKIYDEYYPPHLALLVGDRPEDRECAENAGISFMDAKEWRES